MSIDRNVRVAGLGLLFPLLLGGCSGGGGQPPATPAASATAVATMSSTPTVSLTPGDGVSPLGGTPASEAEKEYYGKKKEAEDLSLARNYEKAIPIFEELHTENPDDVGVMFYLMMGYGATEEVPSKKSKAYEYAQQVLTASPDSREANKARAYIATANLVLPANFKYTADTMFSQGNWVMADADTYKASSDIPFHSSMTARLGPLDQSTLWETEASPATSNAEKLPKGTEVKVLSVKDFMYGLTSWRKALPAKPDPYDKTMFDVSAMYVEITSEGPLKGKKGWIVNHADRYLGTEGDEWGTWISNRLRIPREADLAAATPTK